MVEGIKMLTICTTSLIAGQSCSCQVGNIPSLWLTILPRVAFLPSSVRQWLPASDLWDCSGNLIPSGQSWRLSSWTLDVYDVMVCVCVFQKKELWRETHALISSTTPNPSHRKISNTVPAARIGWPSFWIWDQHFIIHLAWAAALSKILQVRSLKTSES